MPTNTNTPYLLPTQSSWTNSEAAGTTIVKVNILTIIEEIIRRSSADIKMINQTLQYLHRNGQAIVQGTFLGSSTYLAGRAFYEGYHTDPLGGKVAYVWSGVFHSFSAASYMVTINWKKNFSSLGFSCYVIGVGLGYLADYITGKRRNKLC